MVNNTHCVLRNIVKLATQEFAVYYIDVDASAKTKYNFVIMHAGYVLFANNDTFICKQRYLSDYKYYICNVESNDIFCFQRLARQE